MRTTHTASRPPSQLTSSIRIGARHRRDLGDIDALAASIADIGLLHPIVIAPNGTLIAGQHRLAACQKLGWQKVPVTIVDLKKIIRGEYAENQFRKNLTLEEKADIADAVEPLERAAAKQRRGGDYRGKTGKFPELRGQSLDKVGKAIGMDRKTLEKARAVRDAAKAEPKKYRGLLDDMNRTGRVDGPYKRLKNTQQAAAIRAEPPPLPGGGPYRVATVDVPWPYEINDEDPSHRGAWPYPTMSMEQICALDVTSIMHQDDAILWMWATNFHMRVAFEVLAAWGFSNTPTILTWAKNRAGHGHWLRGQTEHCIMAVRGKPIITLTNQTTLLQAPVRGHSVKPREFYNLVESLCPAPRYAGLFSRYRHNEKWDCHGNVSTPADFSIANFLDRRTT